MPRRPRLWPVFAVYVTTLFAVLVAQLVVAVGVAVWLSVHGLNADQLEAELLRLMRTPSGFLVLACLSQVIILSAAIAAAVGARASVVEALGVLPARLTLRSWAMVLVGTLLVGVVACATDDLASSIFPRKEMLLELFHEMTWEAGMVVIPFIVLAPALAEELFFRGYIQRRLLLSTRPSVAMLLTALMFSAYHIDPVHVIAVMPIALWLGYLAWRLGSIWPGTACHALNNALASTLGLGLQQGAMEYPPPAQIATAAVLACLLVPLIAARLPTRLSVQ